MARRILSGDEFDSGMAQVAERVAAGEKVIVYFYGDLNDEGVSWCGDCAEADAIIRSTAEAEGTSIVEVAVGDRKSWKKDDDNKYRKHERYPIGCVPTLMKLNGDGSEAGRLLEEDCKDAGKLKAFYS